MGVSFLILLHAIISALAQESADPIVQLPQGTIRGHILKSDNGNEFYAYQEIPYAAPPVGPNRFKPPKSPEYWKGILDATKNQKICLQSEERVGDLLKLSQSEDCLYLNVYTPLSANNVIQDALPVFVYIHGGGYLTGSGSDLNPKYLIDQGIVMVSMNYRLGPLGFLTTLDKVIPGNLGLKDQHFAIKWTTDNIHLFGGDPKKVTIGGCSAGAGSIGFQVLSKRNEGLLKGAIQESGSAIATWSYQANPKDYAFNLGRILNNSSNTNNSEELLNILLKVSAEDIINAGMQVQNIESNYGVMLAPDLMWCPVMENSDDEDAFITAPMREAYMMGAFNQVPHLIGFNSEESLFFFRSVAEVIEKVKYTDSDVNLLINPKLHISSANRSIAGAKLKNLYTPGLFENDLAAYVQLSSESGFNKAMTHQAEISSSFVPVYLYEFSYVNTWNRDQPPLIPGTERVGHSAETGYLYFDSNLRNPEDLLKREQMIKMWTNFIKYQNPTPERSALLQFVEWPTVKPNGSIEYLNINATLEVLSNPKRYEDVKKLFYEYIKPPYIVF